MIIKINLNKNAINAWSISNCRNYKSFHHISNNSDTELEIYISDTEEIDQRYYYNQRSLW